MICILDASAAIEIALNKPKSKRLENYLKKADWIIAPDIFISEVANTFWKYHQFEDLPIDICEDLLDKSFSLIDDLINTQSLYKEAFSFSCLAGHPVYDSFYLILTRRHNGILLTSDQRLIKLASKQSIRTG